MEPLPRCVRTHDALLTATARGGGPETLLPVFSLPTRCGLAVYIRIISWRSRRWKLINAFDFVTGLTRKNIVSPLLLIAALTIPLYPTHRARVLVLVCAARFYTQNRSLLNPFHIHATFPRNARV